MQKESVIKKLEKDHAKEGRQMKKLEKACAPKKKESK